LQKFATENDTFLVGRDGALYRVFGEECI
jgi:hypothetical protein